MNDVREMTGAAAGAGPGGSFWSAHKRQVLIGLGLGAVVLGALLNWNWLVAVGAAPIILALLPCAAMCAIGVCAMRGGKQACHGAEQGKERSAAPASGQEPAPRQRAGAA